MKRFTLVFITLMLLGLGSCKKDNPTQSPETSQSCNPSEYCFTTTDGLNTVNYSGQETRLNQLLEINTYLKSYLQNSTALSAAQLKDMFSNGNGNGSTYFSDLSNAAGKQLKDKCFIANVSQYEQWFDDLEVLTSTPNQQGSNGVGGLVSSNDASKTYLLDANGFDLFQLIQKGLMGDVFYYQAMNIYLAGSENGAYENTDAVNASSGQYYTEAEHKFDEAFGYFGIPVDFDGSATGCLFFGEYCIERDAALNNSDIIFSAFKSARTAISDDRQEIVNAEIEIIREEWSKIIFGSILHYLKEASNRMDDPAIKCHVLSEAIGFSGNLIFNRSPYNLSVSEVAEFNALLGDNLYDCSTEQITQAATFIFNKSGFSTQEYADL